MSDLQELTNELMQDAAFRKEYEALQPERPHVVFDSCEKGSRTYASGVIRETRNQSGRYQQIGEWHKESQFGLTESYRRSGEFDAENRVCTEPAPSKIVRNRKL